MTDPPAERADAVSAREWWQALGGPNAISSWSWILTSAAAILVAALYDTATFGLDLWPRLALVAATQAVSVPLVYAAHLILARLQRPRPVVGLVLMIALGAARGAILMLLAPTIEPLAITSPAYQFAINIAFSLLTLPFIAIVVDALRRHRALQARVVAEQARWSEALVEAESRFAEEYAEYRQIVERDISSAVVTLLDDLDRLSREVGGASSAAEQLRHLSADVVRPLSHELILEASPIEVLPAEPIAVPGRLTIRDVLTEARVAPFAGHWGLAIVLTLLGVVGLMIQGSGLLVGINLVWDIVIFGVVPGLLARAIGRRIAGLPGGLAWAVDGAMWLAVGAAGVVGTGLITGWITGQPQYFWTVGVTYAVLAACLAVAFGAFRRQRRLDLELLRVLGLEEARASRLLRHVEHERRRLGLVLHGTVQSNLTRAALGLERWDPDDPAAMEQLVADVRIALQTALAVFDPTSTPVDQLATVRAAVLPRLQIWDGVVTWRLSISDSAEEPVDPVVAGDAGDVVGEALVNAVRHGQAERVDIAIGRDARALVIQVTDDGIGVAGSARAGAGFGGMARAGFSWTLDRQGDRTVLVVRIPCAADGVMETEQHGIGAPGQA